MSIAQLFFRKGNYIQEIELDIIVIESAQTTSRLTENPVEQGANVNDHIIIEPMTFTVEGVVSNSSSTTIGQFTQVPSVFNQDSSKAKEAWNDLLELQASRQPFTLVQGLREYNNIVILSLNESQDKDTSNGLFFTATMKEVILVGVEPVTEDRFVDTDTYDKAAPTTTGGVKPATEVTP
jgi:hypothetical protein